MTIMRNREKKLADVLRDPKNAQGIKPQLFENGRPIEYYSPRRDVQKVSGHTYVRLMDNDDFVCNVVIEKPAESLDSQADSALEFIIDADFRPQVTASMIKAAHLTLFKLFGYRDVLSPGGLYVGSILRGFFEKFKPPAKCEDADVAAYFREFKDMVAPVVTADFLGGTIVDNRLLGVFGGSECLFAIGVIVKAGKDKFCVFVPGTDAGISTYLSFQKERPQSIAVRVMQWMPASAEKEAHFECLDGEPARLVFAKETRPSEGCLWW